MSEDPTAVMLRRIRELEESQRDWSAYGQDVSTQLMVAKAALEDALGYLRWFNTSNDGTPDCRILREKVAEFLAGQAVKEVTT